MGIQYRRCENLVFTRVSNGVFGWQRSAQDAIHVTVFPTDIALWVGGNVGNSGANNINAGAFANAQALIDDLEANNGEFGPTDEDFDDTKPLIYYNEALGSLRAITRAETRSTLVTVFTESAVPAGVLEAEGYRGDFARGHLRIAPDWQQLQLDLMISFMEEMMEDFSIDVGYWGWSYNKSRRIF